MDEAECAEITKLVSVKVPISEVGKTLRLLGSLAGAGDRIEMEIDKALALEIARAIEAGERPARVVTVPVAAPETSTLAAIGMAAVVWGVLAAAVKFFEWVG